MSHPNYLSEQDVRAVVNLLGRVAVLDGDHRVKRRFVSSGLAQMVGADVWMSAQMSWSGEVTTPVPFLLLDGGWQSDQQRALMFQWHNHPGYKQMIDTPLMPLATVGRPFTRSRPQLIDDEDWYQSVFYRDCRVPTNIDDFMYSVYPVGTNSRDQLVVSNFAFYRFCGKPPFNGRDRTLVHLVSSEVDWLHRDGTDVPAAEHVADLPPRLYQVMLLLLSGDSTKQIAFKLEISQHTVNDYVKSLHRRFGVSSRGELLAQFLAGDAAAQTHASDESARG